MSDMISRDDLIRKYGDWYIEEGTEWGYIGSLENLISKEPAVDAVPVVRCKYCKHREGRIPEYHNQEIRFCLMTAMFVKEDFFCAHGERKDDDDGGADTAVQ